MQKNRYIFISILCIPFFVSCTPSSVPHKTQTAMNTVCTIQLFEYGTDSLYKQLFDRLDEIEKKMSATITSSEISHINNAAGDFSVEVTAETFKIIEQSLQFARKSGGAFNPAMGPLVSLWNITGFNPMDDSIPLPEEVREALNKTDYTKIILNTDNRTVFLQEKGMALDLGGIAKGWAADELIRIIAERKVPYAIVNLGGNIYAYGKKASGEPWNIGIKNPFDSNASPIISIATQSASIVTSGVYERFFEKDGVMYHHILDRQTGYPVQNDLVSVTIVHSSSMEADALSTLIFALGRDDGIDFLNNNAIKGILITKDYEVYTSLDLVYDLEILDSSFILMD